MLSDRVKLVLGVALFLALALYHFVRLWALQSGLPQTDHARALYSLATSALSAALFLASIYAKWVAKVAFRGMYVGGRYEGHSEDATDLVPQITPRPAKDRHIEEFEVQQDLFDIRIEGSSFVERHGSRELMASWTGRAFKQDGRKVSFAIELTTSLSEYGILHATFAADRVDGYYWSSDPDTRIPGRFTAKRIG